MSHSSESYAQSSTPTGAHQLLNAVERMLATPEEIRAVVEGFRREGAVRTAQVSERVISHYSNWSALAGGASAVPGIIPGIGTLTVVLGSTLAEMAYVLKLETEMCLALSYAHGFDVRERRERQLALLLAAVHTSEVTTGRNVLLDIGDISLTAVSNYGTRELEKLLLRVSTAIAIALLVKSAPKALLKAIPFIGIGIGAGFNKFVSTKVGRAAQHWLVWRRWARQERRGHRGAR